MNKLKIYLSLLIVILCFATYSPVLAQSISNFSSNTNIDAYSDADIKSLLQQAKTANLSDDQLIQMARSRGVSDSQVQHLQTRIAAIRTRETGGNDTTTTPSSRKLNPTNTNGQQIQPNTAESRIFGANIFRNSDISTFQPNLKIASPVNYILGPDDQLLINLSGQNVNNWSPKVSAEGNINIPNVGIIKVAGKTLEQAKNAIKSKLANYYPIDKGTNVVVNIGDIRSIKVRVIGQVVQPATYTLTSLSTVLHAMYASGGPSDLGSFRQIDVRRNNKKIRTIDLYDYITTGSIKDDLTLQDQDVIYIPTYRTHIELAGEVKIPAIFEPLPGETLQDIINFAGGFTEKAYTDKIKVTQISGQQQKISDIVEQDYKSYIPLSGDIYSIDKILTRFENRVTINGAVFRPGPFELQKGLTLSQLIKKAAGLKEDAFMNRGTILRLNTDNTTQEIFFNVADILNKTSADILLQREDIVTITSIFDLRDKYNVTINGEVRNPGNFAYADNMRVEDLIIKAGGFTEGASSKRISVSRRILDSDLASKNSSTADVYIIDVNPQLKETIGFVLKPFDIVSIYSSPGYQIQSIVKVEGEVLYAGPYIIQRKNEKISDIIIRAGGLTASADVEGGTLKRSNIAILGIGKKGKVDTAEIVRERNKQINRLKQSVKDSTDVEDTQLRNDYVGIDLKKILNNPGSKIDLILEDGDVIRVPKEQQIVRVNGEVLYPSAIVYNSGKSFNEYVLNAGGFSSGALKKRAYIVYPNGTVKGTRKILFFNSHPSVKPGSEIYVPKKPVSTNNTGQLILGYTTGLASLGAIILGILSLNK